MKKLAKYLRPYWYLALLSPLMMIGEVVADLFQPKLMSVIVDCGIVGSADIADSPLALFFMRLFCGEGPYTSMQIIICIGAAMMLLVVIGGFFGTFCAFTAAKAAQSFGHDLRCDAYGRVMSLSIEQTDKFTTGSLVTRMTNDVSTVTDFVEMLIRMFVRAPIFFVGGTIMLLTLDLGFGTVLLCALPVLIVMLVLVLSRATPLFSQVQTRLDKVNSVVQENVGGARVVKAYVREEYENERFDKANSALRDTNYRVLRIFAVMSPILNIIMNGAVIAVILIAGLRGRAADATVSVGSIMAAITYITQVLSSVMMVTMMFQSVSRAGASARRVVEVLDSDPVIRSGEREGDKADVCVSFRNVGFRYPGTTGRPVLHDINLDVHRGEVLAVIGATGAGKTSLVNLIPRFYDATEGSVTVDGLDVREWDVHRLRERMGFVMQKSELFSDTVAGNIRWGKPDATDAEVEDAADVAQASGFINGFNEGYNTFIAEKGASLSGGQKQRMSIARALVRKPEILILDDSTSALDLSTEARLQAALRSRLAGTTVIMIAQRIASVRNADRIAVIENGTIKDCAPHDELMKISAAYRDIYDSQMQSNSEKAKEVSENE